MGWFTSADLNREAHRKPVGSLFLQAMDRDSIRPAVRRTAQRQLADRSLPNTAFSFYNDEPMRTRSISGGGRRHFRERRGVENIAPSTAQHPVRKPVAKQAQSHLDNAMQTTKEPLLDHFTRRKCREPPFESPSPILPRSRAPSPLRRSHLSLGDLVPKEESPKKRPVPPPMIKEPLHCGRRHTSAPRSVSAENRRIGVRMSQPLQHKSTAPERQAAFLNLGVGVRETLPTYHKNQSNWDIGYFPRSTPSTAKGSVSPRNGKTSPHRMAWRGRGRSATPMRRGYDIISWTPM